MLCLNRLEVMLTLLPALAIAAGSTPAWGQPVLPPRTEWHFDEALALPSGWKVEATHPAGSLATWVVRADPDAPSKPNVLELTAVHDSSRGVFNLCWTGTGAFRDGRIEVKVRANTGKIDQGGGPIWRVHDANNYYLARYNPLEKNFRLYYVKNGKRVQLADASGIDVPANVWFAIQVVHEGNQIRATLNGMHPLEVSDQTIPEGGGVGVWTKADAASSFDDFTVLKQ